MHPFFFDGMVERTRKDKTQASRIHLINWIIACKSIFRRAAAQRIGLGPSSGGWVVVACAVVIEAVGYVADSRVAAGGVVTALEQERVVRAAVFDAVFANFRRVGVLAVCSVEPWSHRGSISGLESFANSDRFCTSGMTLAASESTSDTHSWDVQLSQSV